MSKKWRPQYETLANLCFFLGAALLAFVWFDLIGHHYLTDALFIILEVAWFFTTMIWATREDAEHPKKSNWNPFDPKEW